jgi:hypothetical protein
MFMSHLWNRIIPCIISSFCLSGSLLAAEPKEFFTRHGFTVTLTDDWVEIPEATLTRMSAEAVTAGAPKIYWNYGYQLATAGVEIRFPYILMQIKEGATLDEDELRNSALTSQKMQDGLNDLPQKDGLVQGGKVETTSYDAQSQVLFSSMTMDVAAAGKIHTLTAIKPLRTGHVEFHGYCSAEAAATYEPFYKSAVKSFKVSAAQAYDPTLAKKSSFNWKQAILSGIIGGLLGGLYYVLRKRFGKKSTAAP